MRLLNPGRQLAAQEGLAPGLAADNIRLEFIFRYGIAGEPWPGQRARRGGAIHRRGRLFRPRLLDDHIAGGIDFEAHRAAFHGFEAREDAGVLAGGKQEVRLARAHGDV